MVVRPGNLHPVEPGGVHVLSWVTPNPKRQNAEASYVVLRQRKRQLKVSQNRNTVLKIDLDGHEKEIAIETTVFPDGLVYVDVSVDGAPRIVALDMPDRVPTNGFMYIQVSSLLHGETHGPEVPNLGWGHDVEYEVLD